MAITQIDRRASTGASSPTVEVRAVEAMLECIGRWGVAKTTADDVAREAGISRATLYRAFPGGREVLFDAMVRHEAARFFRSVSDRFDAADDLEDLLVHGALEATSFLQGHDALRCVLAHEPELVLPAVAFHRLDRALDLAIAFTVPHLARFVADRETAERGAEWMVRLLLSYVVSPSSHLDLADPASVRRFVRTYVLPVLQPSRHTAPKER